jgi:hypothetical protein
MGDTKKTGVPQKVFVATSDTVPTDERELKEIISTFAKGVWNDFKLTNQVTAGKAAKVGAGLVVGGAVAKEFGALTPLRWALRGFGPLPMEFTASGAIQVFVLTTVQRATQVAIAAGSKFILVTVAYEGGILIGSIINQTLSESTKDAIGGTINEIINEGGWKLLFEHPFGIGM